MNRHRLFYLGLIVIFGSLLIFYISKGKALEINIFHSPHIENTNSIVANHSSSYSPFIGFLNNIKSPFSLLILQIITIIIAARIFGYLLRKLYQPTVMGEILAGIVLGPSLLGYFFPEVFNFLFPVESIMNISFLSNIGLILFMFIIGMEVDLNFVKKNARSALMISNTSILVPFSLGILLAYYLYSSYALKGTSFLTFSLFMGIALSITAFPVLARIIAERGITKTPLGIMTLTAAAANDITGWCLLACVIAIAKAGNILNAIPVLALSLIFVFAMLILVRPLLKRAGAIYVSAENMSKTVVAFIILFVFVSAYFSDVIGIHALFGAFIAGIVMPENKKFKEVLSNKIEDISLVLLLPLFFVFTGLRTQIGVINNMHLLLICLLIIAVAVVGKFGGGFLSAKISGMNNKDSLSLGVLMNTRGLMELIVLNIGYDMGILSTEIFTIFVIMALATTFMTGPLLNLIDYIYGKIDKIKEQKTDANSRIKILISFAKPEMGSKLLKLAAFFTGKNNEQFIYSTIHTTPSSQLTSKSLASNETEIFNHINNTANELNINLQTFYKVSEDYTQYILKHTRKDKTDWLLVGSAKSLFTDSIIGGSIKNFLDSEYMNVGVLIDRDFNQLNNCVIIIKDLSDLFIFGFILWLTDANPNLKVKLAFFDNNVLQNAKIELEKTLKNRNSNIDLLMYNAFFKIPFTENDLTILSINTWKDFNANKNAENIIPTSILILKPKIKHAN